MRITFIPHAIEQMAEREIPEERARAALEEPDGEYPGDTPERTVAERTFAGERSAIKCVYTLGLEGERVVVSVFRGRPKFTRAAGGEGR